MKQSDATDNYRLASPGSSDDLETPSPQSIDLMGNYELI